MRLDRWITLGLVRPLRRVGLWTGGQTLPILMYHSISADPEPGIGPYYRTATAPQVFRQHLELLRTNGYRAITLSKALGLLGQPSGLSKEKLVVLTFDDGFHDFYAQAAPMLGDLGFSATMFLPTAFIGDQPGAFCGRRCMTWNEVNELHHQGIEFGSHTLHHPRLLDLDWPEIAIEVGDSKSEIEARLGSPVPTFAYPYAFPQAHRDFVSRFRQLLRHTGYQGGVTTTIGRAQAGDDLLCLRRLPMNSCDDPSLFMAKVEGGYDWLSLVQSVSKAARHRLAHQGISKIRQPESSAPAPKASHE